MKLAFLGLGVMGFADGACARPARETCAMYTCTLTRSAAMASTQAASIMIFAVLPGLGGRAGSGSLIPA